MNFRGVFIVYIMFAATLGAFFLGGYDSLKPTLFLVGLFLSSVVCIWGSMALKPRSLTVLMAATLLTAFVDEYAHTSAGVFTYFDGLRPSPLTVFGWGLFILGILTIATLLGKMIPPGKGSRGPLSVAPALISIVLIAVSLGLQGYIGVIDAPLAIVYLSMGVASVYYSLLHPLGWNVSVMASSVAVGAAMEFMGAIEGMWSFHFMEPIPPFMAFTWSIRTWTILSVSRFLGADIAG